ncbi:MAG: hypothetical protein ABW250_14870 [Pyrinomonadaceae bacterium]
MSNDQSPPARKVIPYKKGGTRKSPFADMAFQFSGTALDVAIQQREEGVEETSPTPSEAPAQELPESRPAQINDPILEVEVSEIVRDEPQEPPVYPDAAAVQESSPSQQALVGAQTRRKSPPTGPVRPVPGKRGRSAATEETDPRLQAFVSRWKPFLTETQLSVCAHIFNNSIAVEQEYCFTSTAKLMTAVSKTERQVKTVVNQLVDWGFLVKGETIINTSRENRGTHYKLVTDKS